MYWFNFYFWLLETELNCTDVIQNFFTSTNRKNKTR